MWVCLSPSTQSNSLVSSQTFSGSLDRHDPDAEVYNHDACEPDKESDERYEHDDDNYYLRNAPSNYGSDAHMGDLPAYMNVGVIPTTNEQEKGTGRIVTFPNWIQHRVVSVFNDPAASAVAVRKIVSTSTCLTIVVAVLTILSAVFLLGGRF
jgi:hypothetical protein